MSDTVLDAGDINVSNTVSLSSKTLACKAGRGSVIEVCEGIKSFTFLGQILKSQVSVIKGLIFSRFLFLFNKEEREDVLLTWHVNA